MYYSIHTHTLYEIYVHILQIHNMPILLIQIKILQTYQTPFSKNIFVKKDNIPRISPHPKYIKTIYVEGEE